MNAFKFVLNINYLKKLIELSKKEVIRTAGNERLNRLSHYYLDRYSSDLHLFRDVYKCNLIEQFKHFQDIGVLEIITCGATHGYFPILYVTEQTVKAETKAQISQSSQLEAEDTVKKKKFTIMGLSIWRILAYFIIYSVVGYIIETLFGIVTKGRWESRQSFLYGPFCAIYGLGAVIMIIFLHKYSSHMSNSEIAQLLEIREGTVRQRIFRGKQLIEDALKKLEEI